MSAGWTGSLGDFLDREIMPRLTPEQVFTHPSHQFQKEADKWRGGCPHHNSKSGTAFVVNPRSLEWWCPACGAGGSAIQYRYWLKHAPQSSPRGDAFVEAVRDLAHLVNLDLPTRELTAEQRAQAQAWETRRAMLTVVIEAAQRSFWDEVGFAAREFMEQRGFSEAAMHELGFGYFWDREEIEHALKQAGHDLKEAREMGITAKSLEGFVIIPWFDERGRPLTLYGRWHKQKPPLMQSHPGWLAKRERLGKLWSDTPEETRGPWIEPFLPKTVALPGPRTKQSPLYLDRALKAHHKSLVLVEGVLDAAILQAGGETNVIACVAAQLSREQAACLTRHGVERVVICLDPDKGGESGVRSCIKSLDEVGIIAYVAPQLPDGQDPDEFVIARGIEAWRGHIAQSEHAFRHLARELVQGQRGDSEWTDTTLEKTLRSAAAFAQTTPTTRAAELDQFFWDEIRKATGIDRSGLTAQLTRSGLAPSAEPSEIFAAAVEADEGARVELIRQLARSVARAPDLIDLWGDKLKVAGFIGKTAFKELAKAQKQSQRAEKIKAAAERRDTIRNEAGRGDLPRIEANNQDLPVVSGQALDAIRAQNEPPFLFISSGVPQRLFRDGEERIKLEEITEDRMRYILARVANWYTSQVIEDEVIEKPALPPGYVCEDLLAHEVLPFPSLYRLVEAPVFGADGKVMTEPGYHPSSRTYFAPASGLEIPEIPANPSAAEIEHARNMLLVEVLGDFPFVSDAERAHAVSFLVLPFIRELIVGPTPLYLVDKPGPGTGATLLVDVLSQIILGHEVAMMTEGESDDEWRKRITAKLIEGPSIVVIDNIRKRVDSGSLALALTVGVWEDRALCTSRMARISVKCGWIGTGNNITLSDEMTRRVARIRMDAKMDQPQLRPAESFRHKDLKGWAQEHRGELVASILTLCQAWIAAGKPLSYHPTLGMYEGWSRAMGGLLKVAGIPGFLENINALRASADAEGAAIRTFIGLWWGRFGERLVTTKELWEEIVANEDLELQLGNGNESSRRTRLGFIVKKERERRYTFHDENDQPFTLLILKDEGKSNHGNRYQLKLCDASGGFTRPTPNPPAQPSLLDDALACSGVATDTSQIPINQEGRRVKEGWEGFSADTGSEKNTASDGSDDPEDHVFSAPVNGGWNPPNPPQPSVDGPDGLDDLDDDYSALDDLFPRDDAGEGHDEGPRHWQL